MAALSLTAAALPAGIPDHSEVLREHRQARTLALKAETVARQAKVDFIAERYKRPAGEIHAVVDAAEKAGARHGLPSTLLLAMMETESGFNQDARSGYGARGLMQVVPRFHPAEIKAAGGLARIEEPAINIDVGARILARYLDASGDLQRALDKYSGGSNGYASKVLKRKRQLEQVATSATRQLDSPLASRDAAERLRPPAARHGSRPSRATGSLPASADASFRRVPRG